LHRPLSPTSRRRSPFCYAPRRVSNRIVHRKRRIHRPTGRDGTEASRCASRRTHPPGAPRRGGLISTRGRCPRPRRPGPAISTSPPRHLVGVKPVPPHLRSHRSTIRPRTPVETTRPRCAPPTGRDPPSVQRGPGPPHINPSRLTTSGSAPWIKISVFCLICAVLCLAIYSLTSGRLSRS
jgi:hypothetical protein